MPVTVVPTSLATVAIDTFMTELSSVIRNCAEASVSSTVPAAATAPRAPSVLSAPTSASRLRSMPSAFHSGGRRAAHSAGQNGVGMWRSGRSGSA
jgi:hypothetical protein